MKNKIISFFKTYFLRGNIFLLLLNIFYIGIFTYSMYYKLNGYYFVPDHRIRFLRIFMLLILIPSFLILSPSKKSHRLTPFSVILLCLLPITTCLFVCSFIQGSFKYEAAHTLVLIVLCIALSTLSVYGTYQTYNSSKSLNHRIWKICKYISVILNILLVIIAFSYLLKTGLNKHKTNYNNPSFSTMQSPNGKLVLKTERVIKEGSKTDYDNYICVYKVCENKKVKFLGEWIYNGKPVKQIEVDDYNNMEYIWLDDNTFMSKGVTYTVD